MLAVNLGRREGELKDTARNLRCGDGFVVNVVTEDLVTPMHRSSSDYPAEVSEPELLGLELVPSLRVRPPRIAASPIAMECVLHKVLELGEQKSELVIGEVVTFHVSDELLRDGRIDIRKFHPLARLGGPHYARLGEIITMPRVGNPGPAGHAR
jgi:flavin reductase (DIM6/NTAB) family NADH-FMN oxidoreductase RutF